MSEGAAGPDPAASPTPMQIVLADAQIALEHVCDGRGVLTVPNDLAFNLTAGGKGDRPVAMLRFRCRKCGRLATPRVTGPGNSLTGRRQLWPPAK